jgi:glyoxylase-like metal-dependent hydrolase (beta-lactamase superfamily II)
MAGGFYGVATIGGMNTVRTTPSVIQYAHGICAVDADYLRPMLDAIHLVVEDGRAAVIDTGTQHSVPAVLAALRSRGVPPERVEYVLLTHIHLDHAGGAGELMRLCPNATLTVHPRGVRHMADPSRLIAGTVAVYGQAATREMYGDILPVAKERILETPDGASVTLGKRRFTFHDVAGHARHHVCIRDERSGHVFAGDTFGISYRELDHAGRQFAIPTTSPVQFEPEPYHRSIDLIARLAQGAVYVTHYSQLTDVAGIAARLHALVDAHAELALAERDAGDERHARLVAGVERIVLAEARRFGTPLSRERVLEVYGLDIDLNAQGLGAWLDARG